MKNIDCIANCLQQVKSLEIVISTLVLYANNINNKLNSNDIDVLINQIDILSNIRNDITKNLVHMMTKEKNY